MNDLYSVCKYPHIESNSIISSKNDLIFFINQANLIKNDQSYIIDNDASDIGSIYLSIQDRLINSLNKFRVDQDNYFFSPEALHHDKNFLCLHEHANKLYSLEILDKGRDASIYSVVLMHYATRYSEIDHINEFFRMLDIQLLTSWSLIALLRSTSMYKQKIETWRDIYYLTYQKVEEEGLNPARELYGLNRGL